MAAFFASGHAADLILFILTLELVWLAVGGRLPIADAIGLAVPGMLIVLGLRAALTDAEWPFIAGPLALALPVHLLDLRRRLASRRS